MSIQAIQKENLKLESGYVLPQVKIAFKTYGKLNKNRSNVIWVCHALTASAEVKDWWPNMFGAGKVLDSEKFFIVCPNFLGSCYGTTGASSEEISDDLRGKNFPLVTIKDMVEAHRLVLNYLNLSKVHLLIGASLGGQQALQWAVSFPDEIEKLCLLATNAVHSPWGKAFNASQRLAIEADETFQQNIPNAVKNGLKAARSIALLSYRTPVIYNETQIDEDLMKIEDFNADSYQRYQGDKLIERFDAYSYYGITKSMDSHNVARGFKSLSEGLSQVKAKTFCLAIRSDFLFRTEEMRCITKHISKAEYLEIDSKYGHDGFLIEAELINKEIMVWLNSVNKNDLKLNKMKNKIKIGLFGYGCVGQGFYKVLKDSNITEIEISKIVVKNKYKERNLPENIFYFQPSDILIDTEINTVIELIDDAEAAYKIVKSALKLGKNVISANKKMIAQHQEELIDLARENQVSFLYEASVCGSIPIIRNIEEYFKSDKINSLEAICNGTTNYILSQAAQGLNYAEALKNAQDLGFAESDPTLDVDGYDAKYKLGILLNHAFGIIIKPENIINTGIRHLKENHSSFATTNNSKIKLYSFAKRIENKVIGFVAPFLVQESHSNFNVDNEFNSVNINAEFAHEQTFVGRGAGSIPTASAVLSDIKSIKTAYKYTYKKENPLEFTNDFYLKIILFGHHEESLNALNFDITEKSVSEDDSIYKTGWIHFENLSSIDFNDRKDLFFIVVSEKFVFELDEIKRTEIEALF